MLLMPVANMAELEMASRQSHSGRPPPSSLASLRRRAGAVPSRIPCWRSSASRVCTLMSTDVWYRCAGRPFAVLLRHGAFAVLLAANGVSRPREVLVCRAVPGPRVRHRGGHHHHGLSLCVHVDLSAYLGTCFPSSWTFSCHDQYDATSAKETVEEERA